MATTERESFLVRGNSKLGDLIHAFSLPARSTCPGATLTCLMFCYALGFVFTVRGTRARHDRNRQAADAKTFATDMVREVRARFVRVLRIHVAGDFFSEAYIRAWIKVARSCPKVEFFAYTRSWAVPELLLPLIEFAGLSNVALWFSEDRDTVGQAPVVEGIRIAYLAVHPDEERLIHGDVDLVFLDDRHGQRWPAGLKWFGGALVCPEEQRVARQVRITCSSCRLCVRHREIPRPKPC